MIVEQISLALLGVALAYLISEINQIQSDLKKLLLDVAVLKDRERNKRATDQWEG